MNINLPFWSDMASAFGPAYNDGRSLLENLGNENYQADVTKNPEVWSHTASIIGLLAVSAQNLLNKMPPAVLSEVGKFGLTANIMALAARFNINNGAKKA